MEKKVYQVSVFLLFLCLISTLTADTSNPTHFSGDVSVNCGSSGKSAASDGTEWLGDVQPKFPLLLQMKGSSTASHVSHKLVSDDDPVPYSTARLSRSRFSYAFQVNPGQKILRLHFNPTSYKGYKRFKDLFAVDAGHFSLLSNFSASLTAYALGVNSFVKEFYVNIEENRQLEIVVSPASSWSLDTYAFINGIEIISVPASLSHFHRLGTRLEVVGKSPVHVDNNTALEIVQQISLKQDFAPSARNVHNMFGVWETIPEQKLCNLMNNATWKISVDVGFRYLVRLYFSKLGLKIVEIGGASFKVHINEVIVCTNTDIVRDEDDEDSINMYKDYMVTMKGSKFEGKRDVLISLESDNKLTDGHGPLKGFEVLKLSNHDNSLASPNPNLLLHGQNVSYYLHHVLSPRNIVSTVAITLLALVNIIAYTLREILGARSTEEYLPSARAKRQCRRFSLSDMQAATRNFSDAHLIGRGGFGKVYKGLIDNGLQTVAIKRLKSNSSQGVSEFLMEIETLTEVRHINLVSLIGYCSENREMILVYEYMACGTLADHLYKHASNSESSSSLTWKQRLTICIGACRGLDYLHTGNSIIHRDVKTSNILLDESFRAKVSDFGLAKHLSKNKLESHVSTKVKGTFGYIDPKYVTTARLTMNSDTYAFGVVLLEALSGRRAVDHMLAENEKILTEWARENVSMGRADRIIDPNLRGEITEHSLLVFLEIAEKCLHDEPNQRPTMAEVVLHLMSALEQQECPKPPAPNELPSGLSDIKLPFIDEKKHTPSFKQAKGKVVIVEPPYGEKDQKKSKMQRWPWDAFRKRVAEIESATESFSDVHLIGKGGFGSVYKGHVDDGETIVAIKRLAPNSNQGKQEFAVEMETLIKFRHHNLVSLIGYCHEQGEMMLVYEYMANGTLADHLYNGGSSLTWKERLKICIGAGRGLDYLHSGCSIIHRDVKSTNILLDENFTPKVSDFGLAKLVNTNILESVSASVKGSFGYFDPSYFITGRLTMASDNYAFGVVLLEVLSGRPAVNRGHAEDDLWLTMWAQEKFQNGKVDQIVASNLRGEISDDCLKTFLGVAKRCLHHEPKKRLTMTRAVALLEVALEQHERKGSTRKLQFLPFNGFWSRVIPSGSTQKQYQNKVEVHTLPQPIATIEEDALEYEESVIMQSNVVPTIPLKELKDITHDFSSKCLITYVYDGGSLFHGVLRSGLDVVVKKLRSRLSDQEFLEEVSTMSSLEHENVVKLLGYCADGGLQILVYEFASRGSLHDILYGRQGTEHLDMETDPTLSWDQRIKTAIGLAQGLLHLHDKGLIHRNITSRNVLLFDDEVAKITDIHLSTKCTCMEVWHDEHPSSKHISCCVYHPWKYDWAGHRWESDVYSFGVILLELLTGHKPSVKTPEHTKITMKKARPEMIVDSRLKGDYPPKEAAKMAAIAASCLQHEAEFRPNMSIVLRTLQTIRKWAYDYT